MFSIGYGLHPRNACFSLAMVYTQAILVLRWSQLTSTYSFFTVIILLILSSAGCIYQQHPPGSSQVKLMYYNCSHYRGWYIVAIPNPGFVGSQFFCYRGSVILSDERTFGLQHMIFSLAISCWTVTLTSDLFISNQLFNSILEFSRFKWTLFIESIFWQQSTSFLMRSLQQIENVQPCNIIKYSWPQQQKKKHNPLQDLIPGHGRVSLSVFNNYNPTSSETALWHQLAPYRLLPFSFEQQLFIWCQLILQWSTLA